MSWFDFLFREVREVAAPISKEAVLPDRWKDCVHARESKGIKNSKEYPLSTVIIHGENDAYAEWDLEIPKYVRKRLIDVTLKIETVRTHGLLHTHVRGRSAKISVNGGLLDHIYLVRRHPHGEDFGVDSRRPISVVDYIDKANSKQTIRIWVGKGVSWDVDRVILEPIILRREIRTEAAMIIGAIISALIGALVGFYL
jgi:hypothetical protein